MGKARRCPVCGADIKPGPFSRNALNPHYRKRHPEYFLWLRRWTRLLFHVVTPTVLASATLVLTLFPQFLWYLGGGLLGFGAVMLLTFYLRVGSFRRAWQVKYNHGLLPASGLAKGPQ